MQEKRQGNEGFHDRAIDQLPVSDHFKNKSVELGFSTIRNITDLGWGKVMKIDGFCYSWFNELVKLLKNQGLLELLETK